MNNENRPPIFDERNRLIWDAARRFMIFLLHELDKWYGWETWKKPQTGQVPAQERQPIIR